MDRLNYLRTVNVERHIQNMHEAITKKFPIENTEFDAWYTNKAYVLGKLSNIGRAIARKIREDCGLTWAKDIPAEPRTALQEKGVAPENWEDGPDGTLAGVAILVAGWVANQAAAKSRDNPNDCARQVFERCIRPLIIASMDLGVKMVDERQ